ncbi:hypothetical protein AB9Q10_16285 [Streptomyces krungchingensis]|uniref:hypothetical protein n=1 Tax=Streptomyces krungchingensis TaxID=1565034 RepID=UPI003CEC4BE3
MPKLGPADVPEVKLDSAAATVGVSMSREMRRGLFEKPGMVVYAIVELTSKSYTGHAEGEDKDPQVKVRVTGCEVARSEEDAKSLIEARAAMYRGRQIDGTFDEVGKGPIHPGNHLDEMTATKPTEADLKEFKRRREQQRRDEYAR